MAYETRGKGRYYYQKERIGERVVSRYVGAGAMAQFEAEQQQREQARRAQERAELARLKAELVDPPALVAFNEAVRLLTRAALVAAGYHQHARGEWRRPRE
jgi:hypothetical protein